MSCYWRIEQYVSVHKWMILNSFSFSRKGCDVTVKMEIKLTVSINIWYNSVAYCLVEYPAHYVQASALKKGQDVPFLNQLLHQIMRQKHVTLSFKYETTFCSSLLVFTMLLWGDTEADGAWREKGKSSGPFNATAVSTMTEALLAE